MTATKSATKKAKTHTSSRHRGSAKRTTDHNKIMRWAEERGGHPTTVKGTTDDTTGVLRIDFPGRGNDAALEEVSWDAFFKKFDQKKLAFLFQDKTASGRTSRFGKFVGRNGGRSKPGKH